MSSGASESERARADRIWYLAFAGSGHAPDLEPLDEQEARAEFRAAPAAPADVEQLAEGFTDQQTVHLLSLAQGGSRRALSALMERYHPRVLQMVRRKLGRSLRNRMDSGDVVQDVLAETLRSLKGFKPRDEQSFQPWLRAMVENRIRNLSRNQRPARSVDTSTLRTVESPDEDAALADWEEKRRRLDAVIEGLEGVQGEVVRLRYRDGLSYREIADRMGRSEAAVSMLLSRARVTIARALTSARERS